MEMDTEIETGLFREAEHRLKLLGDLIKGDHVPNREDFKERGFQVGVRPHVLKAWYETYRQYGIEGLMPEKERSGGSTGTMFD